MSFFDLDVDIKRFDYVIVPNKDEPLVVDKVRVYDGRPPGHKEVVLIEESKFLENIGKSRKTALEGFQSELSITLTKDFSINNFTVDVYLNALENAVDKSNIPKGDRNKLIKKIREIKENPYIENLNTTAIVEVKQIIFH